MQNLTVHLGSVTLLSSRASPRARARNPCLPALTATGARPVRASAPLSEQRRAARASPPGRGWPRHGRGAACRSGPGPTTPSRTAWHFCGRTPPPLFSFPLYRTDNRVAQARLRPLVLPSPLISDSSSRAAEPPHRSPHLDRRLRPPAAHSPSWIPAEHRRRPPLPGEIIPELPIPAFSCNFLPPPLPLRCCRTPHPPLSPTGAPSPPTNAAARRRLSSLTVDPSFRCAPALSSLPGTFPATPLEFSGNTLPPSSHRRAVGDHATASSRTRSVCGDRAGARAAGCAGRLARWAGLPGRGRAGVLANRVWQAATSRGF
jgi:hypothetical protein